MSTPSHAFTAVIETGGAFPNFLTVPDSEAFFGTGRPVKVVGTVDGHAIEATPMLSGSGGHWLPLRKAICVATGKCEAGEPV